MSFCGIIMNTYRKFFNPENPGITRTQSRYFGIGKIGRGFGIPGLQSLIGYGFLLVFYSNFVPRYSRFEIFDFKNAVSDLENRVRGPLRSLEMSPFDRAHATSY